MNDSPFAPGKFRRCLLSILLMCSVACQALPVATKPELALAEIYKNLSENKLRQAQAKADELVKAYPHFQLGHLVQGDLLLMHARPVSALGAAAKGADDRLGDLRQEAGARLRATMQKQPTLLPRALLQLRKDQRHALLVDARRSRMYLYEHRNGQIRLVSDFYVSQGKLGINKSMEGDMRTPVGVYYLVSRLAGARLPDMYGKGALPLSYPNDWDRVNGRGGSGIWLHGTPSDAFSRAPLATDGCVVVSNDDLKTLIRTVEVGKTPILIGDQVEFLEPAAIDAERQSVAALVEAWRRDVEGGADARVLQHYSARFKSGAGVDASTWIARQHVVPGAKPTRVTVSEPSYFREPSKDQIIVSNFIEQTVVGKYRRSLRKQQYWAKEGGAWKIVAESNS